MWLEKLPKCLQAFFVFVVVVFFLKPDFFDILFSDANSDEMSLNLFHSISTQISRVRVGGFGVGGQVWAQPHAGITIA